MPVGRGEVAPGKDEFARYPPGAFATMHDALVRALVERQVGRNGWAVMFSLSHRTYADGRLGRMSAKEICERTGLTSAQVARGMAELRDKGIIAPVIRKTSEGFRHPDRSNFGHVAQYCITRELWAEIVATSSDENPHANEGQS